MNTKVKHPLARFYQTWKTEDRTLEAGVDGIRDWMHEVDLLGFPRFGETATRLGPLREQLIAHFERENEMTAQLAELYPSSSPEVEAVRRQATRDHHRLLDRLESLKLRLDQPEPPFPSWQAAMDELESFIDLLEQHEDQESECIEKLMPGEALGKE